MSAPAPGPGQAETATITGTSGNLRRRVVSSVVMAVLAIAAVVAGGWAFVLFWTAAAIIIAWEWMSIVTIDIRPPLAAASAALLIAAVAVGSGRIGVALGALAAGALAAAALSRARRAWSGAGVLYAGVLVISTTLLRAGPQGAAAMFFLFAVVWMTDILGYFVGRAVGGPRLALRISPKKTWSGAGGGALGALVAGMLFAVLTDQSLVGSALTALALSLVSQGGDLVESAIKRRFGVKDAS
ncbi:MAG: phosphatidate cytidylyltransferase, partial [Xanthobacteraceae bacterium]|nr:phosphatidate cytidylyltransferase [Xanthobacteraceae bacterium]